MEIQASLVMYFFIFYHPPISGRVSILGDTGIFSSIVELPTGGLRSRIEIGGILPGGIHTVPGCEVPPGDAMVTRATHRVHPSVASVGARYGIYTHQPHNYKAMGTTQHGESC